MRRRIQCANGHTLEISNEGSLHKIITEQEINGLKPILFTKDCPQCRENSEFIISVKKSHQR